MNKIRKATIGLFVAALSLFALAAPASAVANDGTADSLTFADPTDAQDEITDHALEFAPTVLSIFITIFLVSWVYTLVRRGMGKTKGTIRV